MTIDSIDLSSSFNGIHVITELDEIRKLVSSKSREIHFRESQLGKSVSQFNLQLVQSQELIEQLAHNLLQNSERHIEVEFEIKQKKLERIAVSIEKKMAKLGKQKFADVPPIDVPIDWMEAVFTPKGRLETSAKLVACKFFLTFGEESFILKSLIECAGEIYLGKIHSVFLEICKNWKITKETKFIHLKKNLFCKRLGINDTGEEKSIEVLIDLASVGGSDVLFENKDTEKKIATVVRGMKKSWKTSLAEFILGNRDQISWIKKIGKSVGTLAIAVYFLIQPDTSDKYINEFKKIDISKLIQWKQGLWYMIHAAIDPATSPQTALVLLHVVQKTAQIDNLSIQPWKNVLIEKIDTLNEQIIGPVKALIRLI